MVEPDPDSWTKFSVAMAKLGASMTYSTREFAKEARMLSERPSYVELKELLLPAMRDLAVLGGGLVVEWRDEFTLNVMNPEDGKSLDLRVALVVYNMRAHAVVPITSSVQKVFRDNLGSKAVWPEWVASLVCATLFPSLVTKDGKQVPGMEATVYVTGTARSAVALIGQRPAVRTGERGGY